MKKRAFLLAALFTLLVSAAQAETPNAFYVNAATEVATDMDAFASSNAIAFYTMSPGSIDSAHAFGFAACHAPNRILLMEIDRAAAVRERLEQYAPEADEITDAEITFATEHYSATLFLWSLLFSMDSDQLSVIALCRTSKSYRAPEGFENDMIALLVREDADILIACSFVKTGEGILGVAANYLPRTIEDQDVIDLVSSLANGEITEISIR